MFRYEKRNRLLDARALELIENKVFIEICSTVLLTIKIDEGIVIIFEAVVMKKIFEYTVVVVLYVKGISTRKSDLNYRCKKVSCLYNFEDNNK